MKVGIAAIFKNEADYILEWLAYHQLVGVDNFYIADNVSDDGTSQLLEALDHLGIIRRVYFPRLGDDAPQPGAYNRILGCYGDEVDLLAFIDADEFIASTNGRSLKENLEGFYRNPDAGALALNWRNFGSAGESFGGSLPVIERFTRCSRLDHPTNRHIKTVVKPAMAQRMLVHHGALKAGRYYGSDARPTVFEKGTAFEPRTALVVNGGLRVNHYVVKSRQEHILKKLKRGSAAGNANRRKGEEYFNAHDLNECEDNVLVAFAADVRQRVADLKQRLVRDSPYLSFGTLHTVVRGAVVQGWVRSEYKGSLRVRLLVNGEEYLSDVDQERPDVVESGAGDKLVCGFRYRYRRPLSVADDVKVSIYGSHMEGEVRHAG